MHVSALSVNSLFIFRDTPINPLLVTPYLDAIADRLRVSATSQFARGELSYNLAVLNFNPDEIASSARCQSTTSEIVNMVLWMSAILVRPAAVVVTYAPN